MKKNTLLCALLLASAASADTLFLEGGDRVSGKIVSMQGDNITFETVYAGTLTIKKNAVTKIETDEPLLARVDPKVKDYETVTVSTSPDGSIALIPQEEKDAALSLSGVSTLWKPGAEDPDFPKKKLWTYSAALGLGGRSGNNRSFSVNANLDAVRSSEKTTTRLYFNGAYERTDGSLVTQTLLGGLDYEYRPNGHCSWYLRDELSQNKTQGIDFRNIVAGGYGWYFWQKKKGDVVTDMLRARIGLGHNYTKYKAQDNSSEITGDFGIRFRSQIREGIIWNTELTYVPTLDDFGDFYLHHVTTLEFPLDFLKISQELGVSNDYVSRPDSDRERLDTVWFIRFKKSW